MIESVKKLLYFPVASYFRFFAAIRLKRWNPKIIVVTGSNGKTTLLHLLESQIGEKAKYSHHANSSYGIPFDILDLHRKSLLKTEWFGLFLKAPFNVFNNIPKEKLYVVEADCDRPGEGKFLAELLTPDIVLWISTAKTHSMNFEYLVSRHPERSEGSWLNAGIDSSAAPQNDRFNTVEEAIAYEFGYFLEYAKELVLIDGDSKLMNKQISRTKAKVTEIKKSEILDSYDVGIKGTEFKIDGKKYTFAQLLPEEVFYSIAMCRNVVEYLELPFDPSFSGFHIPPGRGSIFEGIKNTTIVDSSYNANLSSMKAIISMYAKFTGRKKWVVLADMLELGNNEKSEHEQLADVLNGMEFERIILIGPLNSRYTFPILKTNKNKKASFKNTKDVLPYLKNELSGEEIILFKGSQSFFTEWLIEGLLKNKEDAVRLARRGKAWDTRRTNIGLSS